VSLNFAFQTDEKLILVLDYCPGGDLGDYLRRERKFSEERAKGYICEIILALEDLHKRDIIFRDLKPENIVLDGEGHALLTDFGLSKDLGPDNQEAKTFCGTPEYLAPEIVKNKGHSKPVDWWALGILLYELTVGIPPFYSQNVNEMYKMICESPLRFPPSLSQPIRQVITGLLKREPQRRLGSATDVEEIKECAFFRVLDFDLLYRKEIDPPYRPNVKSESDTSNFDVEFTGEAVQDSYCAAANLGNVSFDAFTFAQQSNLN